MSRDERPSSFDDDEKEPLAGAGRASSTLWLGEEASAPRGTPARHKLRAFFTSPHLFYLVVIFIVLGLYVDQISVWLPAACYDEAVVAESESNDTFMYPIGAGGLVPWPFYWDKEQTRPATLRDLQDTAFYNDKIGYDPKRKQVFTIPYEYHRAHCLHMWRLGVSAAARQAKGERNIAIYRKVQSMDHARHCTQEIVEGDTRKPDATSEMMPGIGRCVGLDDVWNDVYRGAEHQHQK